MSITKRARPEIQALEPYRAAVQVADTVRLNANEAPWTNGSDRFRRPLNRYPEVRPSKLRDALAARFRCNPGQLLVTRGSSEGIDLLIRSFCVAGTDNIVTAEPGFSMYPHYAVIQGIDCRVVRLDPRDDFRFDITRVLDACDEHTKLVFACSPNNPTGTLVPREVLFDLATALEGRAAVVVDEAYIEFATANSVVDSLDRHNNLVVLRTLSKALAFAGARCGAVIGPDDVVAMLNAVQAPYALATPVVECVEDALEARWLREAQERVRTIVNERERLVAALSQFDSIEHVWPSDANFLLVRCDNVDELMKATSEAKVLLRYFGAPLADCVRITVGSREENDRLLECLETIKGGSA
jgi:histidinol-phosphate aminotransferase